MDIQPEIERQMHIKPLPQMPEKIEGHLTLKQIEDFRPEDRQVLIAISKLEQTIRWSYKAMAIVVDQARASEAEMLQKVTAAKTVSVWFSGLVIAAIVGAVALKYIHP